MIMLKLHLKKFVIDDIIFAWANLKI